MTSEKQKNAKPGATDPDGKGCKSCGSPANPSRSAARNSCLFIALILPHYKLIDRQDLLPFDLELLKALPPRFGNVIILPKPAVVLRSADRQKLRRLQTLQNGIQGRFGKRKIRLHVLYDLIALGISGFDRCQDADLQQPPFQLTVHSIPPFAEYIILRSIGFVNSFSKMKKARESAGALLTNPLRKTIICNAHCLMRI